jgi:4-hydroxybenzoyl-CoA thioesterase
MSPSDSPRRPPFVHRITVRWADCDPAEIAYTGRLPYFALEAIESWWVEAVGLDWFAMHAERNYGAPFVHIDLDFRAPVTPRFPLDCEVTPTRLGKSSIAFRVVGRQDGQLCFEGNFVSAFVTSKPFAGRTTPPEIRALIEPLLEAGKS